MRPHVKYQFAPITYPGRHDNGQFSDLLHQPQEGRGCARSGADGGTDARAGTKNRRAGWFRLLGAHGAERARG